jgi:orotidine-5'-phosphate decarboxylase
MSHPSRHRLALALDVASPTEALDLVDRCADHVGVFKIGLQLFCAAGPGLVRQIKAGDAQLFLDLKLHDIPNTVGAAVRALSSLGVDYLTVHAAGGTAMLRAAAAEAGATKLLAVTVLTSMSADELTAVGVTAAPEQQARRLAKIALQAGITGLVCSPQEAPALRRDFGDSAFLTCPGIRPEGFGRGDQKRTATPAAAIRAGADLLVVGRPIRTATDPAAAAAAICAEIEVVG